MKKYKTEQEKFWAGKFGNEYIERNKDKNIVLNNTVLFSDILRRTDKVRSIIEFGANIGMNLIALHHLCPEAELSAVEINQAAATQLEELDFTKVYQQSILDFKCDYQRDFVLTKGVLIHINPTELLSVYDILYESSSKYICVAEYFNPTPVEITYREHTELLFKRDFAGEMLKRYSGLKLIDYGFVYHGDPNFPQDDITWFLMEK